jgi:SIR2-like domain
MTTADDLLTIVGETLDNRDYLRMLVEQVQSLTSVVPFVGSGISVAVGFPGWNEFLLNEAKKAKVENHVQKLLQSEAYEDAADQVYEARGHRAFQDAINSTYRRGKMAGPQLKGAVLLLPFICTGPLITTNYDCVLEETFERSSNKFIEVVYGADADRFTNSLHLHRRALLKIHGDAESERDRILTRSDYAKYYGGNDAQSFDPTLALPRLLKYAMIARSLLFIGCSLSRDRTMAVLKAVADENRSIAHYAIVECPRLEADLTKRAYFLSARNIRPIWYKHGEHDKVESLLKELKSIFESSHPFDSSGRRASGGEVLLQSNSDKPGVSLWSGNWIESDRIASLKGLSQMQLPGRMEIRFSLQQGVAPVDQDKLLAAVKGAQIHTFGWPIAVIPEMVQPQVTTDSIKLELAQTNFGRTYDYWHLRQNGDFYQLEELFEDSQFSTTTRPGTALFFNTRIVRVTEALLFAARLYTRLGVPDSTAIKFGVRHGGLKGRLLIAHPNSQHHFLWPSGPATEDEKTTEVDTNIACLLTDTAISVKALLAPLFILFNLFKLEDSVYDKIVSAFIAGRVQ